MRFASLAIWVICMTAQSCIFISFVRAYDGFIVFCCQIWNITKFFLFCFQIYYLEFTNNVTFGINWMAQKCCFVVFVFVFVHGNVCPFIFVIKLINPFHARNSYARKTVVVIYVFVFSMFFFMSFWLCAYLLLLV